MQLIYLARICFGSYICLGKSVTRRRKVRSQSNGAGLFYYGQNVMIESIFYDMHINVDPTLILDNSVPISEDGCSVLCRCCQ